MHNWQMLTELGQIEVQERIEAAERSRRFKHLHTGNSLLSRFRTFIRKPEIQENQEQEQSTLPNKPAVPRGV